MSNGNTPKENDLPQPLQVEITGGAITTRTSVATPIPGDITGFWVTIKNRATAMEFPRYDAFINRVLCQGESAGEYGDAEGEPRPGDCAHSNPRRVNRALRERKRLLLAPYHGVDTYNLLRAATEAFLLMECGVFLDQEDAKDPVGLEDFRFGEPMDFTKAAAYLSGYLEDHLGVRVLPYLKRIVDGALSGEALVDSPYCFGIVRSRLTCPCLIELIWSYWLEEGMLVQSMNALTLRFQNRRSTDKDALLHLELDPLRPMSNLLWGYLQDENNRLTLARRTYEYDHHYGVNLVGKAVPKRMTADSRSRFLEAFHMLLNRCAVFFKEESNTMVIPDGFPLLNALQEVHLLLAEGMHNQYGDLPWTARVEMLIMQWLLARPEIKDFLRARPMVPYTEGWMGQVDAMKTLQGWHPSSITHFRNLAVFGEQVLLSVRFGNWNDEVSGDVAKAWAHYWKPEIQGYLHAYRAVTGVDLTVEPVNTVMPGLLLRDRVAAVAANGSRSSR